jgi:hypothetical protein
VPKLTPYNNSKPFKTPLLEQQPEHAGSLQPKIFTKPKFEPYNNNKQFKSPLIEPPRSERRARKTKADENETPWKPYKMSLVDHEAMIAQILHKAFKVPMANYIPEYTTKTLGPRKNLIRR